MKLKDNIQNTFRAGANYKYLLLSVLITGLSYGLYKGMLDSFLAEVVAMGEMDRGITEFFRELPGILLVFILYAQRGDALQSWCRDHAAGHGYARAAARHKDPYNPCNLHLLSG